MARLPKTLVLVAMVLAAGMLITVSSDTVVAQIKAALVKNVDEPGRTPWDTRSQVLSGCYETSDCFNYDGGETWATFDLRPVPAGKRWIVRSATAGFTSAAGLAINVTLHNNRGSLFLDGLKWAFAGPYFQAVSFNALEFNSELFATFGPGETPTVRLTAKPNLPGYTVIVFNGYLIDAH